MHLRRIVHTALFLLLAFAAGAENSIRFEILSPHYVSKGNGVTATFNGCVDDCILSVGGVNADDGNVNYHDNIWRLSRRGWFVSKKHIPYPLAYGASVTTDDALICISGTNMIGNSQPEVYKVRYDSIENLPPLPEGVDHGAATLCDGYIYLAGGQTDGKPQHNVYRLAYPGGSQWELYATMPGQARLQPCVVVQTDGASKSLYVFGGYDPSTYSIADDVLKLNLTTGEWSSLPQSEATVGMAAVAVGYSHVLFFGGVNRDIFTKGMRGELDNYMDQHPLWYKYNADILVYHTITDSWYSIPGRSFLARAGASLVDMGDAYVLLDGENKPGSCSADVVKVQFLRSTSFGAANWAVLITYLVLLLVVGVYFVRRERGGDDFFRAGGRVPWWAAGISIYATMLSAITYMAIPAKTYATNWTYYPISLTVLLVLPLVVKYYLPYFRRLNVTSAYEYLEARFNAGTRLLASALFIVFMLARMSLVLYLPSLALTAVTGIDIYTCILLMGGITIVYCTLGGVEAVVWGDVLQGIILVGGAFFAAGYLLLHTEGGVSGAMHIALADDKMRLFQWSMDYRSVTFWVAIIGGFANSLFSYTGDQTVIQRYMTTRDEASARKGLFTNVLMCVFVSIVFYLIGTGLYTFYKTHPASLDFALDKADSMFPFFMMSQLPQGVAGLLIAAIFAATMSTIGGNISSVSTAFGIDFWKRFRPQVSERELLRVARVTCVVAGLVGMGTALVMATWDILSLLDCYNTLLGLLTGGIGGLFFMGIFLPRIRGGAAFVGIVVGTLVVFWVHFCTDASLFLYGFVGMAVSVTTAWLLSLFSKPHI